MMKTYDIIKTWLGFQSRFIFIATRKGGFFKFCYNIVMDIIGKKFGRLTVLDKTSKRSKKGEICYLCQCSCGNTVEVRTSLLTQGKKRSCGCLYQETRQRPDKLSERYEANRVDGVCVFLFGQKPRKQNSTGVRGVYKHNSGYRAKIVVNRKSYFGKTRSTIEEAQKDRLALEEELLPKK